MRQPKKSVELLQTCARFILSFLLKTILDALTKLLLYSIPNHLIEIASTIKPIVVHYE